MHLVYLDDSDTKAKLCKWQVMAGVVVKDESFNLLELVMNVIREDLVPPEKIEQFEEFHACELYGGYGVFDGIDREKRLEAIRQLLSCLKAGELAIVYGGVNLHELKTKVYGSADPLDMAFRICAKGVQVLIEKEILSRIAPPDGIGTIEEIAVHAVTQFATGFLKEIAILIVDDFPDRKFKDMLHKSFRSLRSQVGSHLHDDMYFGDSRYSIGIQLADLCSYFIARHLEGDGDADVQAFYETIEPHIVFSELYPEDKVSLQANAGEFRDRN